MHSNTLHTTSCLARRLSGERLLLTERSISWKFCNTRLSVVRKVLRLSERHCTGGRPRVFFSFFFLFLFCLQQNESHERHYFGVSFEPFMRDTGLGTATTCTALRWRGRMRSSPRHRRRSRRRRPRRPAAKRRARAAVAATRPPSARRRRPPRSSCSAPWRCALGLQFQTSQKQPQI